MTKHGFFGTPEYQAFHDAKRRCQSVLHKQYPDYGGRGIQFRFSTFQEFIDHIGVRPDGMSLDRINNDGHYEVGNVRWATPRQQTKNRRRTDKQYVARLGNLAYGRSLPSTLEAMRLGGMTRALSGDLPKLSLLGNHMRHHVNRGIVKVGCSLCQ